MNLEDFMLGEMGRLQKDKYCTVTLQEWRQRLKVAWWLPGAGEGDG